MVTPRDTNDWDEDLTDHNPNVRISAIEANGNNLPDQKLIKFILDDPEDDVAAVALGVLHKNWLDSSSRLKTDRPIDIVLGKDTFERAIGQLCSGGIKAAYIAHMLSMCPQDKIKEVIQRLNERRCLITNNICNRCMPPTNKIFIAHEFSSSKKNNFRKTIESAIRRTNAEMKTDYESWYADINEERKLGHVFCPICEKLQSSALRIFDLDTPLSANFLRMDDKYHRLFNSNVMLEFGLAFGLGKPSIVLIKSGLEPPSDINGLEYVKYTSYAKLEDALLPKVIAALK